jgi:hypothetical protein
MEQISMGDILDQTVKRKATTAEIYIVRTGRKVLYIGQSASVHDRLEAHLGLDWRADRKFVVSFLSTSWPPSSRPRQRVPSPSASSQRRLCSK